MHASRFVLAENITHANNAGKRNARVGNVQNVEFSERLAGDQRHAEDTKIFDGTTGILDGDQSRVSNFLQYIHRPGKNDLVKMFRSLVSRDVDPGRASCWRNFVYYVPS